MSRSLSSSRRGRCSTYRTCWQMLGRRVLAQRKSDQHTPRTVVLCLSLPSHVNKVNEACRAKGLCDTSSDGF